MSRDSRVYLEDILEAAGKISKYVAGMDFPAFAADSKTQDAVVRNLEIIGEAVRTLPEEIRSLRPAVDWRRISGLRNILIHEYFGVDVAIVWDIVQNKVPGLEAAVRTMLAELG
jgi:uncharacterized protein with HEPN domain